MFCFNVSYGNYLIYKQLIKVLCTATKSNEPATYWFGNTIWKRGEPRSLFKHCVSVIYGHLGPECYSKGETQTNQYPYLPERDGQQQIPRATPDLFTFRGKIVKDLKLTLIHALNRGFENSERQKQSYCNLLLENYVDNDVI